MTPKKDKPNWVDPDRHPTLVAEDARALRRSSAARLHAIRLRKLDGDHAPSHLYDAVSAAVRRLADGRDLYALIQEATSEWPHERVLPLTPTPLS